MTLREVLTQKTIRVDIDGMEKGAAITCLVDLLAQSTTRMDASAVLSAVLERERQGSTGLENGIAIPHARCAGLPGVMAALGISRSGMDFESADGKPCHLIFLVVAPPNESAAYLQVLSAVALIGETPGRMSRLRGAASAEEAFAMLGAVGPESA
jgi:mannitol/fructose-specific phosphotransferase system IIA component (Ntr-type)